MTGRRVVVLDLDVLGEFAGGTPQAHLQRAALGERGHMLDRVRTANLLLHIADAITKAEKAEIAAEGVAGFGVKAPWRPTTEQQIAVAWRDLSAQALAGLQVKAEQERSQIVTKAFLTAIEGLNIPAEQRTELIKRFLNGLRPDPEPHHCVADCTAYAMPGSDYCRMHHGQRPPDMGVPATTT